MPQPPPFPFGRAQKAIDVDIGWARWSEGPPAEIVKDLALAPVERAGLLEVREHRPEARE
jgi:hypothetical protein